MLLNYFQNLKKKIEDLQVEIADLYGQLRESREARQQALNAAQQNLPDMQAAIDNHGNDAFLSITSLKLDTRVRHV